jgi:hypothetical protein
MATACGGIAKRGEDREDREGQDLEMLRALRELSASAKATARPTVALAKAGAPFAIVRDPAPG